MKMTDTMRACLTLLLLAVCAVMPRARGAAIGEGLAMQVAVPPAPVRVEGRWQLSYEVRLSNRSGASLSLEEFSLLDAQDGDLIARIAGDRLTGDVVIVGSEPASKPAESRLAPLAPGEQAVLFVDIALPHRPIAGSLRQRLSYRVAGAPHHISAPLVLSRVPPTLLAPPLRGGPWAAVHSPDWPRGHRRVYYGKAHLPGRYAIDWVKLDQHGRFADGDSDLAQAWYGYGAEVLAVADARVVAVRDGLDEPTRVSLRTTHAPQDDAGNYVTLQLADGRFAFYEHLQKGSIRVAIGDRVAVGEVIAALGFSGESTGPHLHFHVADANSPLAAEGMPFEIRRYTRLGRYDDISRLGKPWHTAEDDTQHRREWPGSNTVVSFPDESSSHRLSPPARR